MLNESPVDEAPIHGEANGEMLVNCFLIGFSGAQADMSYTYHSRYDEIQKQD